MALPKVPIEYSKSAPVEDVPEDEIIRVVHSEDWKNHCVISNLPLRDKRLSWGARGLMAWLMSQPDNWEELGSDAQMDALLKASPAGPREVAALLDELAKTGWITKEDEEGGQ